MSLTPKQTRFIEEFLLDLNATAAAIRAGYSKRTAKQKAWKLRETPEIKAAIATAIEARSERTEITADQVLEELAKIGFANSGDFFEWGPDGIRVKPQADLTPEQQAAVAEVSETKTKEGGTVKVKLHDKVAALDKIGRHLGMFTDNLNLRLPHEDALKDLK
jgi:phage terminase small subunit